jgi:S-phase kinase-associated protein 1
MFELLNAADFLETKQMMALGAKTIANQFADKSTEEMRKVLGIANDLTAEEEFAIKHEKDWILWDTPSYVN